MWGLGVTLPHAKNHPNTGKRPRMYLSLALTEGACPCWPLDPGLAPPEPGDDKHNAAALSTIYQLSSRDVDPLFPTQWTVLVSVPNEHTCPPVRQAIYSASFRNRARCTERKYMQATTCQTLNNMCCPYCTGTTGILEDWTAGSSKTCLIPAKTSCCGQKVYCLLGREDCLNTKLLPFWFV